MTTVDSINTKIGKARDDVYEKMEELLNNADLSPGKKSAALLQAQAAMGISDGVQNIAAKGYNRWQQTGQ
jgi:hypothetical protein